jgi:hypothetical protein
MQAPRPFHAIVLLIALCGAHAAAGQTPSRPHDAESLLDQLDRKMADLQDYQVKGESETNGKRERFKVWYKCPNLVRIDAREGQVAVQPDGGIRGRMGHGIFGRISRGINRDDKRLKDDEGIPFYESHFPALPRRIRQRIKEGATAALDDTGAGYVLDVRCGSTEWKYTFDRSTMALLEDGRWVDGRQVCVTHYTEFKANTGITPSVFRF